MFLIDYDCLTAAGLGPQKLMTALYERQVCARQAKENEWEKPVIPGGLVALVPSEKISLKIPALPLLKIYPNFGKIFDHDYLQIFQMLASVLFFQVQRE